jgi:hypothetical protein
MEATANETGSPHSIGTPISAGYFTRRRELPSGEESPRHQITFGLLAKASPNRS